MTLPGRAGRGLFGNSDVWVTETPLRIAAAVLGERLSVRPGSCGRRERERHE